MLSLRACVSWGLHPEVICIIYTTVVEPTSAKSVFKEIANLTELLR